MVLCSFLTRRPIRQSRQDHEVLASNRTITLSVSEISGPNTEAPYSFNQTPTLHANKSASTRIFRVSALAVLDTGRPVCFPLTVDRGMADQMVHWDQTSPPTLISSNRPRAASAELDPLYVRSAVDSQWPTYDNGIDMEVPCVRSKDFRAKPTPHMVIRETRSGGFASCARKTRFLLLDHPTAKAPILV